MAYISSNANRFYTALESAYGSVATITASNRIPAVKLTTKNQLETTNRRDKTGSRTFPGLPAGGRRYTTFELQTYLTSWQKTNAAGPAYGPLFQAALGAAPLPFAGGTVASATTTGSLAFAAPHGLTVGQAVSAGGELRFVATIVDTATVQLNAPFSAPPTTGATLGASITYTPSTELPSATIFDYWDPVTAVQRLLSGVAVDQLEIAVNGDFHEFQFSGMAQDVVDSSSYTGQVADSAGFPAEPALQAFDYSIVPGSMGEAWLGSTPTQFFTITNASLVLKNNLDLRMNEFGTNLAQCISPGQRTVTAAFDLYSQDDTATTGLYQAARQQSPVSVMFQLGQVEGQVMAVLLNSVIPEVPEFNDGKNRLQWQFRPSRAQGTVNNEIAVAFG
jgi:hypothetical protein